MLDLPTTWEILSRSVQLVTVPRGRVLPYRTRASKLYGTFCLVIAHSRIIPADGSRELRLFSYNCFLSAETEAFPPAAAAVFLACAISPRALRPARTLVAPIAAK